MTDTQHVTYDEDADALYVQLSDATVDHSTSVDDIRIIDYSDDGAVVGIEFVNASSGIALTELPLSRTVEQLIGESGLPFRVYA